jgi:hypothetical protein
MDPILQKKIKKNQIIEKNYKSDELFSKYPPKLFSAKKKLLLQFSNAKEIPHSSNVFFSKFQEISLPKELKSETKLIMKEDTFDYKNVEESSLEWHVNFADMNLFGFYGGSLFAQDEIQVAEHPILASLRQELEASMNGDQSKGPFTGGKSSIIHQKV